MTGHAFVRPGQVAPDRPAPDKCVRCGEPEAAHQLPSDAELALSARINRIIDLTNEQRVEVLVFLAGTAPEALDAALGSVARVTGAEGGASHA